jgi:NitT/TauT family transport system permease protein
MSTTLPLTDAVRDDSGTDAQVAVLAPRTSTSEKVLRIVIPIVTVLIVIAIWQAIISINHIPKYILPGPADVANALRTDWPILLPALWVTLAIAPLLLIYAPNTQIALLICSFLVAFFPILSNMVQGLKSVDHNLLNLFDLYGASRWQALRYLKLPAAQPYFMAGLRIGGGLALIAAVVAEFAAGSSGAGSGLAFRLLEAQYRLNIPRMFAALLLLSVTGVAIFGLTSLISWLALRRWHESAVRREN